MANKPSSALRLPLPDKRAALSSIDLLSAFVDELAKEAADLNRQALQAVAVTEIQANATASITICRIAKALNRALTGADKIKAVGL